jgi:hypothetical protein
VFGRELRLSCDLLFVASPDKERPAIGHAENLVDHLQGIHIYARQRLKLASDRMNTRYDWLASCAGYHEGDSVALSPNPQEGEIAQAPIQGSHPDKWCGIQHTAEPYVEVDGGTLGPARTLSGSRSWRAAFRREQRKQLESNHHENRATGKEGEADHRRHKHSLRERRNVGAPVGYSRRIALKREQCSKWTRC